MKSCVPSVPLRNNIFAFVPPVFAPRTSVPVNTLRRPSTIRYKQRSKSPCCAPQRRTRLRCSQDNVESQSSPADPHNKPSPDSSSSPSSSSPEEEAPLSEAEVTDSAIADIDDVFTVNGVKTCEQCNGTGEIICPVCNGKGFFEITFMDTTSATTCPLCRGMRKTPCPSCRQEVYMSVVWWDEIPSEEEDPEEKWREGPDGPRIPWGNPPTPRK